MGFSVPGDHPPPGGRSTWAEFVPIRPEPTPALNAFTITVAELLTRGEEPLRMETASYTVGATIPPTITSIPSVRYR